MSEIRVMTSAERAKWSRAIHRAMRADAMPALRAAYAMLTPFIDEGCQTMYTDGRFRVGVGPQFFERLTDRQAAFVVMHETMHNTQRHRERCEDMGANQMRWNIAADLEINSMLASGVARMYLKMDEPLRFGGGDPSWLPEHIVLPHSEEFECCPPGLTAEGYLKYVQTASETSQGDGGPDASETQDDGQDGVGSPASEGAPKTYDVRLSNGSRVSIEPGPSEVVDCLPEAGIWEKADELGVEQIRPCDLQKTIEHVRHDLEEERRGLRDFGGDPRDEALRLMLEAMDPPKVDWHRVLRRASGSLMDQIRRGRDDYALLRPNRRRMYGESLIFPSFVSYAPRILYVVDTSASMGSSDMNRVAIEAQGILRELHGRLECVSIDAQEKGLPRAYSSVQEMFQNLRGGGGTDMSAALRLVNALPARRRPDLLVIATDGIWSWRAFAEALGLPGVQGLHVVIVLTNKDLLSWLHRETYGDAFSSGLVTVVDAS